MLRKALSTTVLATVLLTSSISANELTAPSVGSTAKVETISAFDAIPQSAQSELNMIELNQQGENWFTDCCYKVGEYLLDFTRGGLKRPNSTF